MLELSDVASWRAYAERERRAGRRVALVPTMGALHAGHESLLRAARAEGDVVVLTSFVNPRQFNDPEDLSRYPSVPGRDREIAAANGVDCLVTPTLAEMWPDYPSPTPTTVTLGALGTKFEGADRPGHFDGVASVVAKLFAITGPCSAFFGEKDFQQLAVVRQLVRDLGFDVEVRGCPIVRDETGLALSSRNVLLSDRGRQRARAFSRALAAVASTHTTASEVRRIAVQELDADEIAIAYVEVVDPLTLNHATDAASGEHRVLIAGVLEGVRLLDNGTVELQGG